MAIYRCLPMFGVFLLIAACGDQQAGAEVSAQVRAGNTIAPMLGGRLVISDDCPLVDAQGRTLNIMEQARNGKPGDTVVIPKGARIKVVDACYQQNQASDPS